MPKIKHGYLFFSQTKSEVHSRIVVLYNSDLCAPFYVKLGHSYNFEDPTPPFEASSVQGLHFVCCAGCNQHCLPCSCLRSEG
jgi:hypothetical protein